MKNVLLTLLLTTMLTGANLLKSAEIIPVWNKTVEGKISDMEFLKGQNEILMLVGEGANGQIQRRNPENGDLIFSYPEFISDLAKFALTPDSMRFVQINGIDGVLRNNDENFTKGNTFSLQQIQEDNLIIYFTSIAVDPIRPYAYVTTYGWNKNINNYAPRGKVIAYNYETGEHIKDLTPYGNYEYTAIEVSHDGKYLATLNDNKAYLKVWDLETMELIINEPLFDDSDDWCFAEDIYFSKVNPNIIYYSGLFTKRVDGDIPNSIFYYNLDSKIKKKIAKDDFYGGRKLIFLENETKIFNSSVGRIGVIDLQTDKLEYYGAPPKQVYIDIVRYNKFNNYFIGSSNNNLSKFIYDRQSYIESEAEEVINISPNPTNGLVNVILDCQSLNISYQINNTYGQNLESKVIANINNSLVINFNSYPVGIYYLTIECNKLPKTYKIVKEG